jgi:predicted Fe-S protein YdhL (DUF1289 family)
MSGLCCQKQPLEICYWRRVDDDARSELTQLDEQEPEVIARHRDEEGRKTSG